MKDEIECIVTGRVQMVMFRDFVSRKAKNIGGIVGTVKNLDDGSVYILAQGSKEKLAAFVKLLKRGPFLARVKNIEIVWRKPQDTFSEFKIKY